MPEIVEASDLPYDNCKGIFGSYEGELEGFDYFKAYGHVNLNYRKGQKDYLVNISTGGLEPGKYYQVIFIYGHPDEGTQVVIHSLGNFTADPEGNGYLNVKGFSAEDIDPTMGESYRPRFNVRLACSDGSGKPNSWVLWTWHGILYASGSNRGK
ncbi:MAG: hypothetical protein ACQEP5_00010 [Actinomycetota bacterium]